MKQLLLFITLLWNGTLLADEPRVSTSFESDNGKFQLMVADSTIRNRSHHAAVVRSWNLIEKSTNKVLYSIRGEFTSKNAFVSDDGGYVVIVDDWSQYSPAASLPLLEFYSQGQLKKKYQMGELLCSVYSTTSSASHFYWFTAGAFSSDKQTFSFTTFELFRYVFDITSGSITTKSLHPAVNPQSLLVYGEIKKVAKNRYELEVYHRVYGKVPETGKVKFTCGKHMEAHSAQTVLINDGRCIHTEYEVNDWMLNEGLYQAEKHLTKERFEKEYPEKNEDCR
jgi:hypothetical protein